MKRWSVLAWVMLLLASPALAGESFPGTEYISGKAGFEKKMKGALVIEKDEIRFTDNKGNLVFAIPMSHIVQASDSRENEEGSFGRKMALGIFASKTEEFLQIDVETENTAEAVVFKCKKKTSPGIAAKINFNVKALKATGQGT